MAILFDAAVTPDALTAFVRQVPTPFDQVLNQILPDRLIDDTRVRFDTLLRTNRAAKFRAWDARIPMAKRDAPSLATVDLPPLSIRSMIGEQERLQLESMRLNGTNMQPMIDAIYNDADNLVRSIRARMELARGDVLTDGKLTLTAENGLTLEADFAVPAGHIVAPGTLWSTTASATIIANITAWQSTYLATNGFRPGGMWTSTRVLNYMLQNAELRTLAASLAGTPALVTRTNLDTALSAYSLPPILGIYDTVVDVDGTTTRTIPDDKVIFVPPAGVELGFTAWGITATALELVNSSEVDMSFADAPGIVGVVEKSGPPYRQETFVDASGMPILSQPSRLMIADVA
jgi:hypothetical protein